ncbi:MAG: 3-isopropylmalate dehydratase small subunit [Polyangiaceae bacterium]
MSLAKIERVASTAVHVPGEDIDTDRILPGRFLKCVTFDGLGQSLFYDARFAMDGSSLGHPLDDPRHAGAQILMAERNFGCGSSREHAPQAIAKRGFRGIIAESFAEIFFGNATTLGLACVTMERTKLDALAARTRSDPSLAVTIDLVEKVVHTGTDFRCEIGIPEAARQALIRGKWDPIADLLERKGEVDRVAASLPYLAF